MNSFKTLTAAGLVALSFTAQAAGTVDLSWVEPATYSDAGNGSLDRERNLAELARHIATLGKRLPDGQTLKISVTDLRLAGERSRNLAYDYRVLRGRADWPTMQLRYELAAGTQVLKRGESRLANMNYLSTRRPDTLGHEKRMIDDWFKQTFIDPQ